MDNLKLPAYPFKKFWVMSVNNWICDASYNGKELKSAHPFPSFRKFYFIRTIEDLRGFSLRDGISNEDLCKKLLTPNPAVLEEANK